VVYPPTGSTAYEREMNSPPTLLWSMALLYPHTDSIAEVVLLSVVSICEVCEYINVITPESLEISSQNFHESKIWLIAQTNLKMAAF